MSPNDKSQLAKNFLGAYYHKGNKRYASIGVFKSRQKHIGYFDNPTEASIAYCEWKIKKYENEIKRLAGG